MVIKRGLVIGIALFIFFLNSNWAMAEDEEEKEKVYELEEMVITAKGAERRTLPYSVDITGSEEIERTHARTLGDITEGKPGICFESDGPINSRITIRGLARARVSLLLDGNRQSIPRMAGSDLAIDPWDVERIEVIKGANGLSYASDTVGGIINIILKRPIIPETGWSKGYSMTQGFSSVNNEYRNGVRAWFSDAEGRYAQISATYRRPAKDIRTGGGFRIPNTRYRNFTSNLILGYKKQDSLMELIYYGRYGSSIGTYSSRIIQDPDRRHLIAAKYEKKGEGLFKKIELKASYMRFDIDFRFVDPEKDNKTKKWFIGNWDNVALEATTNIGLSDRHELWIGTNFFWLPTHRWQEDANGNFVGDIFPHARRMVFGTFIQDNLYLGDRCMVSGVLRFDYNRFTQKEREARGDFYKQAEDIDQLRARTINYFSPQANLGINYKLTEAMNVRWNIGTVRKPLQPGTLFRFVPATKDKPGRAGNPELDQEHTLNTEIGFNYATLNTELDATAFFTKIYDYMGEYKNKSLGTLGYEYYQYTNQDAKLYGVELGFKQKIIKDSLSLKGAISYAIGSYDEPIPGSGSTNKDLPMVPPLRGFVALEINPLKNMSILFKTRYAARQSRNCEVVGEKETPGWVVFDLYMDYTFKKFLGLRNVNFYIDIINLTDRAYKEHTVQYKGTAIGFEEAYLQPGIDVRTGISFNF